MNKLAVRYTYRKVIMIGGFLFAMGYMLLSISPTIQWSIMSLGVVGGRLSHFIFMGTVKAFAINRGIAINY